MSVTFLSLIVISIVIVITVIVMFFVWMAQSANKINLTAPTDTKPEWMQNTPPKETIAATLADGEGVQVFDYDEGEAVASPFAEQIEDIVQAKLAADPELQQYKADLGTAPDGQLTIAINGVVYANISDIPNARLQAVFNEAVEDWKKS